MTRSPVAGVLCALAFAGMAAAIAQAPAPTAPLCTWAGMTHGSLAIERRDGSRDVLTVRIADGPAEWAQGMQFLSAGVIRANPIWFVFPTSRQRGWHMRNVPIALDIAWTDARGRVLAVERMQPGRSGYGLEAPIRHALELAAGAAHRLGIEPGTHLRLLETATTGPPIPAPDCDAVEPNGAGPSAGEPESARASLVPVVDPV